MQSETSLSRRFLKEMATVRKGNGTTTRRRTKSTAKESAAPVQESTGALERTPAADGGSNRDRVNIERIRRRAYEIFLARGGAHGNDLADWLNAERELLGARKE
jgi:DUF2934 family protein